MLTSIPATVSTSRPVSVQNKRHIRWYKYGVISYIRRGAYCTTYTPLYKYTLSHTLILPLPLSFCETMPFNPNRLPFSNITKILPISTFSPIMYSTMYKCIKYTVSVLFSIA